MDEQIREFGNRYSEIKETEKLLKIAELFKTTLPGYFAN